MIISLELIIFNEFWHDQGWKRTKSAERFYPHAVGNVCKPQHAAIVSLVIKVCSAVFMAPLSEDIPGEISNHKTLTNDKNLNDSKPAWSVASKPQQIVAENGSSFMAERAWWDLCLTWNKFERKLDFHTIGVLSFAWGLFRQGLKITKNLNLFFCRKKGKWQREFVKSFLAFTQDLTNKNNRW